MYLCVTIIVLFCVTLGPVLVKTPGEWMDVHQPAWGVFELGPNYVWYQWKKQWYIWEDIVWLCPPLLHKGVWNSAIIFTCKDTAKSTEGKEGGRRKHQFGFSPWVSSRPFEGQGWLWMTVAWLAEMFYWRWLCWCLQIISSCYCWIHPASHQEIFLGVAMLMDPCNSEWKILLEAEYKHFDLLLCMWADLLICKIQYVIISFWIIKETWQTFALLGNVLSLNQVKPERKPGLWVFWFISSGFGSYLCFCYTEIKDDPGGTLLS